MLCVSAVNPFLSSKVPALNHIMSIRKRITIMLPYVRCPFQKTLYKGLSSRRYLLESSEFFALRDLIDLSKGPFAGEFLFLNQDLKIMLAHADFTDDELLFKVNEVRIRFQISIATDLQVISTLLLV